MQDRGALYVAIGSEYAEEASRSAGTLRKHMPGLPIAIVTDQAVGNKACFDHLIPRFEDAIKRQKPWALANSPFRETLFLDTDTIVLAPVGELFELLENFDAALALSPWHATPFPNRDDCPGRADSIPDVPDCYPTWNTGVIIAGNSQAWNRTVTTWLRLHSERDESSQDQPPFRRAAYLEKLVIAPLSPAYNFRTAYPGAIRGGVRILHGRGDYLERLNATINVNLEMRAVIPHHSYAVRRTLYGGRLPSNMAQLALRLVFNRFAFNRKRVRPA